MTSVFFNYFFAFKLGGNDSMKKKIKNIFS